MAKTYTGKARAILHKVIDDLVGYGEEEIDITVKKVSKKRSLDANAYAWVLIDKIAEKMRVEKSTIYKNAIKEIGGVSTIVCVQDRAVEQLTNGWANKGMGWQFESTPSKINGCTNVTLYFGSSTYDTAQMSSLIDKLVQDAKAIGIDTRTPNEIAQMMSLWEQK